MRKISKKYFTTAHAQRRESPIHQIRITSSDKPYDMAEYDLNTTIKPHYVIDREGNIFSCVPETHDIPSFFPYPGTPNCFEIVLLNLGPLLRDNGQFYPMALDSHHMPCANTSADPVEHPYEYCTVQKYRGFAWYENYTTAQLDALYELLCSIAKRHSIRTSFPNDHGQFLQRAVDGHPGIFLGNAFSRHVTGAHPSVELLNILKHVSFYQPEK